MTSSSVEVPCNREIAFPINAPSWVRWFTINASGFATYHERDPLYRLATDQWLSDGAMQHVGQYPGCRPDHITKLSRPSLCPVNPSVLRQLEGVSC